MINRILFIIQKIIYSIYNIIIITILFLIILYYILTTCLLSYKKKSVLDFSAYYPKYFHLVYGNISVNENVDVLFHATASINNNNEVKKKIFSY